MSATWQPAGTRTNSTKATTTIGSHVAQQCVAVQLGRAEDEASRLKMILAMAEGLKDKPSTLDPKRCQWSKPAKKHLNKEALRRYRHMQLPLDEAPKVSKWTRKELEDWLHQHPITDPDCVSVLQHELQTHFGSVRQHPVGVAPIPNNSDPPPAAAAAHHPIQGATTTTTTTTHRQYEMAHNEIEMAADSTSKSITAERSTRGKHEKYARTAQDDNDGGHRLKRILEVPEETQNKTPPAQMDSQLSKRSKTNNDYIFEQAMLQYRVMMHHKKAEDPQTSDSFKQDLENWLIWQQITDPQCIAFLWNKLVAQFSSGSLSSTTTSATRLTLIEDQMADVLAHWEPTIGELDAPGQSQDQVPQQELHQEMQGQKRAPRQQRLQQPEEEVTNGMEDEIATISIADGSAADSFSMSNMSNALLSVSSASELMSQQTHSSNKPVALPSTREADQPQQDAQNKYGSIENSNSNKKKNPENTSTSDVPFDSASQWSSLISFSSESASKNQPQPPKNIENSLDGGSFATFSINTDKDKQVDSMERAFVPDVELNDVDPFASIPNAIETAKAVKTDAQSVMSGLLEVYEGNDNDDEDDEDDEDDDNMEDSGETDAAIVEEVAWDAPNEIKWCVKVLMIPTDTTSPQSLAEASSALDKIAYYRSNESEKAAQVLNANRGVEWLLGYGQTNQSNTAVLAKILGALGNVAYLESEAKNKIVSLDGISWLLDVSRHYKDNIGIQQCAFRALANIENDQPDTHPKIVSSGGILWMLNVSQRFKDDPSVQLYIFCLLANVASDQPQARQQIVALGGIRWFLRVSQQYNDNADIQRYACLALGNVAGEEQEASQQIVSSGGVRWLLGISRWFKSNDNIQRNAFCALANVSCDEVIACQEIVEFGGIHLLLVVSQQYEDNADIQDNACLALANTARDQPEARLQILSLGGIRWLLGVSRHYRDSASIQRNAFCVLGNIVGYLSDARREIVSLDGIRWLLNVSWQYRDVADIQENAFLAIGYISGDQPEAKQQILLLDGIRWLLDVSQHHKDNTDIQETACLALANIANGRPEASQQIVSLDGIRWLLDVSRYHKQHTSIQSNAFCALGNIALTESEARQQILMLNALSYIFEALKHCEHNTTLQSDGWYVLAVMIFHEEQARRQVIDLNGVQLIVDSCPQKEEYSDYQEDALKCLSTMEAYQDEEQRNQIRGDDAVVQIWISEVIRRLLETPSPEHGVSA